MQTLTAATFATPILRAPSAPQAIPKWPDTLTVVVIGAVCANIVAWAVYFGVLA